MLWHGSVSPVIDMVPSGLSLPLQSLVRIALSLFVFDLGNVGSSVSLQNFARLGFLPSCCGLVSGDFLSLVLDFIHAGFSILSQSLSHLGLAPSVVDSSCLGLSFSLRSPAHLDLAASAFELSHFGSLPPARWGRCHGRPPQSLVHDRWSVM